MYRCIAVSQIGNQRFSDTPSLSNSNLIWLLLYRCIAEIGYCRNHQVIEGPDHDWSKNNNISPTPGKFNRIRSSWSKKEIWNVTTKRGLAVVSPSPSSLLSPPPPPHSLRTKDILKISKFSDSRMFLRIFWLLFLSYLPKGLTKSDMVILPFSDNHWHKSLPNNRNTRKNHIMSYNPQPLPPQSTLMKIQMILA